MSDVGCRLIPAEASGFVGIQHIDDFVGSGDQFCEAREAVQQSVVGTFSEFLLVPSICEEGYQRLIELGIAVYTGQTNRRLRRSSAIRRVLSYFIWSPISQTARSD